MTSWGFSGGAALEIVEKQIAIDQARREKPYRFFVDPGKTKQIVFLDDSFFTFYEHNIVPGGDWSKSYQDTCIGEKHGCPHCKEGTERRLVTVFTIGDLTKYMSKKDQKEVTYQKKLLAVNPGVAKILREKKQNWGMLRGVLVKVSRSDKRSPRSGNDFEAVLREGAIRPVNLAVAKERNKWDIDPYDYEKVLKPSYLGVDVQFDDQIPDGLESDDGHVVTGENEDVPF